MPGTNIYGFWYPELSAAPDVPADIQHAVQSVETVLQGDLALGGDLTVPGDLVFDGLDLGTLLASISGRLTQEAVKPESTSRASNTSATADPHLQLPVEAGAVYHIGGVLAATSAVNNGPDIKVILSFPTSDCIFAPHGLGNGLASGSGTNLEAIARIVTGATTLDYIPFGTSTTVTSIHLRGRLAPSASGTLAVGWAQLTSSASATTVLAQSYLTLTRVS